MAKTKKKYSKELIDKLVKLLRDARDNDRSFTQVAKDIVDQFIPDRMQKLATGAKNVCRDE